MTDNKRKARNDGNMTFGIDLAKEITNVIDESDTSRPPDGFYHCSSLGRCSRSQYFNAVYGKPANKKERFSAIAKMSMALGHAIHDLLQGALHKSSNLRFVDEVPLKNKQHMIAGTCDGIIKYEDEDGVTQELIIEIKSTKSQLYLDKFRFAPKPDHIMQLQAYMWMAGIPRGVVLYFNKDNNQMACHELELDMDYVQSRILDKYDYLTERIEVKQPPTMFLNPKCKNKNQLDKYWGNYLRCKNQLAGKEVV